MTVGSAATIRGVGVLLLKGNGDRIFDGNYEQVGPGTQVWVLGNEPSSAGVKPYQDREGQREKKKSG